jgi:hypothetical protein
MFNCAERYENGKAVASEIRTQNPAQLALLMVKESNCPRAGFRHNCRLVAGELHCGDVEPDQATAVVLVRGSASSADRLGSQGLANYAPSRSAGCPCCSVKL